MTVEVLNRTWEPTVHEEEGSDGKPLFFAMHPYLLGVVAQGETAQDAANGYFENLRRFIEHMQANGLALPCRPTHMRARIKLGPTGAGVSADTVGVYDLGSRSFACPA